MAPLFSGDVASLAGCCKATVLYAVQAGDLGFAWNEHATARLFEDEPARAWARCWRDGEMPRVRRWRAMKREIEIRNAPKKFAVNPEAALAASAKRTEEQGS